MNKIGLLINYYFIINWLISVWCYITNQRCRLGSINKNIKDNKYCFLFFNHLFLIPSSFILSFIFKRHTSNKAINNKREKWRTQCVILHSLKTENKKGWKRLFCFIFCFFYIFLFYSFYTWPLHSHTSVRLSFFYFIFFSFLLLLFSFFFFLSFCILVCIIN